MLKVANSVINASRITGVLPVVNGGTGVSTSTGTGNTVLSAAPTLSGNVNLSTGNLVIGTAGKGIDFSVTTSGSGTMTSELLDDYEEGTWTPTIYGASGTIGTYAQDYNNGTYTKIGNVVYCYGGVSISNIGSWSGNVLVNLPVVPNSSAYSGTGSVRSQLHTFDGALVLEYSGAGSAARFNVTKSATALVLLQFSDLTAASGNYLSFSLVYVTD